MLESLSELDPELMGLLIDETIADTDTSGKSVGKEVPPEPIIDSKTAELTKTPVNSALPTQAASQVADKPTQIESITPTGKDENGKRGLEDGKEHTSEIQGTLPGEKKVTPVEEIDAASNDQDRRE